MDLMFIVVESAQLAVLGGQVGYGVHLDILTKTKGVTECFLTPFFVQRIRPYNVAR